MTDSTSPQNCPKCGAQIPDEAPGGLCPKCVLGGAAAPTAGGAPTVVSGGRRVAAPSPEEIAPHFPDLEILEIVGAGGMGAVYKARQPKLDRLVALKILTQDLAEDPSFVERFNREARVLARLNHPHIVTVYDFGTAGPFCYLLMEMVDGVNLRQAMQTGFTAADTLALIEDICEALKFAHEEGILHRDIKPENILIDSRGRVKIADFGIAKLVGDSEPNDITLTMHGAVLGSPQYMAPEQIETPGDIDQRADIYSLGVVFYELLTGELPLGRFAPPSEKAPMDARIDEIVMRTLEKEREARFQSAGEVETQIGAISQAGGIADQASGVAPQNPSASVSSSDDQPARFALTSAILTGSALLIAVVSVVIGLLVEEKSRFDPPPREALIVGGAILALLTGVPALLGMIFGFRALGEIRRSGGRKSGLGSALFGAMTAPSIAVVAATGGLLVLLLHATGIAIGSPYLIVLIVAIAGPLVAFKLIRGVARWARGEAPEEKLRLPAWRLALNVGLALALAAVAYVLFTKLTENNEEGTVFKDAQISQPANPYREMLDSLWSDGSPDFIGKLSVPPGHVAQIQLAQIEGGGRESTTELWLVEAPADKPYNALLAIGSPEGLQAKQNPGVAALKATLWDQDGGDVQFYDKFFDGELHINTRETQIAMSSGPSDDIELGTLRVRIDPNRSYDNKLSKLYLRVTSAPREKAITAVDTPSVPPLKPGDIPGIEMAYAVPAGQIAVFALQAPWDKDHESPADWYVIAPHDADLKGRITFEITGEYGRGMETVRMVVATLLDDAGKTLATHKFFAPDDHIVSLPPRYPVLEMGQVPDGEITGFAEQENPQAIDLEGKGVHMLVFGHREDSQVVDSLRLLAWSVPRPEGADVGMWISHQLKRLNEKKWSNPIGDGTKSRIFDIEGDVRVRSGFLFDTRERVLKKQGEFQRTESLLVSKGARATIINAAGAKFRVGPQTEDTLIVPHFDNEWLLPSPDSGLTLQVDEWPRGEFTLAMLSPDAIVIREPAAFQLGGDGKLQVLEGEVTVRLGNGEETLLKSGQAFTMPKPDTAGNETP